MTRINTNHFTAKNAKKLVTAKYTEYADRARGEELWPADSETAADGKGILQEVTERTEP